MQQFDRLKRLVTAWFLFLALFIVIASSRPVNIKKAVLSQREQRDAAVNFDMYRILQRHRTCSFPASHSTSFLLGFVCRLKWIIGQKVISIGKSQSDRIFNADKYLTWSFSIITVTIIHATEFNLFPPKQSAYRHTHTCSFNGNLTDASSYIVKE